MNKNMKNIVCVSLIIISFLFGSFIGSHNFYDTYLLPNGKTNLEWNYYSIKNALSAERTLCNATFEMLHDYYQYLDVEITPNGDTISYHNFFVDCIMETDSYLIADSILEGNWGDFYEHWH